MNLPEPRGFKLLIEKPKPNELYETKKVEELIEKIQSLKLHKTEEAFLIYAAYRHTVVDYSKIADFYAHSNKEVQELMEDSALVIIDSTKAIENGYIRLTENIKKIFNEEQ